MNYFDFLSFEKGEITVLGVDAKSDFVKSLADFLKTSGSVVVLTDNAEADADYIIRVPDKANDAKFVMHTQEEVDEFRKSRYIIGMVDINILEKKICDKVIGADAFSDFTDLDKEELLYPLAVAKVIEGHEKYDFLYINEVNNEGKRYLARELAKRHKNTCVRMINTDNPYVERLVDLQPKD